MTNLAGLNFNDRDSQISLLRDSPSLEDRLAAHLMTMHPEISLPFAQEHAEKLVKEFEEYQRTAPDYIEFEETT